MINKHHYKKIFVGLAALFILFAPVGMTMGGGMGTSSHVILNTMPTTGSGIAENISTTRSPYSTFRLTFNLDLAEATSGGPAAGSPPTTGAGAGANAAPQIPNFFSCASSAVTCSVYYVALIVNGAMGVLVSVGAFLVRLGLQFNDNIYNSPAVTTGFSVALAIANLGFVLGIIIIAIATIIRNQTYGIKQLLWKLVFMAILVNFGLVITAPIVGFADGMSNYFINATSPGSMSVAGYEGYAQTMTAAFAPQDLQLGGAQSTNTTNTTPTSTPGLSTGAAAGVTVGCGIGDFFSGLPGFGWFCNKVTTLAVTTATSPSDNFWQMCMAMIFDIVFSSLIVFTFFCLAILLIIRYLMLGGLLIVLPLAWLTYIFPKFDNSFSKWWNTFIKWVFFPPLALFFIYLAFITATNTTGASGATSGGANAYVAATAGLPLPANGQNGTVELALYTQTGLSGVVQQAADEVLLVGLTIMGLMFALSLSGKAGSTVVNGATHASKAVAGYVGKRTARAAGNAASRAASRAVPQKLKENLQAGKYRFVPKRLQVAAGVGLGNFERTGRANLVEAEAKNAESLAKDPKQFARVLGGTAGSLGTGGVSKERRMAMLAQIAKDEDLQKAVSKEGGGNMVVEGKSMQEFLKENEGQFKGLQQEKLYETLKDKSGLTPLELSQKNQEASGTVMELGKKKDLADIQGLLQSSKDPNWEGQFSKEQKDKLEAYQKRKKDLEYAVNTGEITTPERTELDDMRKMEATKGNYMSAEEKDRYQKAQDVFSENNNKLKTWTAKNPDLAADSFQDHDKARAKLIADGKPVPLTFEPQAVKQIQQSILTAMAEGFSPQNAKGLIDAIGKKNNLKYFERSIENMDQKMIDQLKNLAASNKPFTKWVKTNAGKSVVDLNNMFGIPRPPKRQQGQSENA